MNFEDLWKKCGIVKKKLHPGKLTGLLRQPPTQNCNSKIHVKKTIQRSVGGRRGHLALCTREMTGFFWNGFWKYSGNSRTCDKMPAQGSFQKSNELCAKDSTKDLIHRCVFCTQLISVLCPFLSPHEVSRLRSLYVLFFFSRRLKILKQIQAFLVLVLVPGPWKELTGWIFGNDWKLCRLLNAAS